MIIFTIVTTRFPLIFDPNQPLSEWGSLTIHRWLIDIITNTKTSFIIFYELSSPSSLMKLICNLKFIRDNLKLKYFFFKLIFFFKKLLLTYFSWTPTKVVDRSKNVPSRIRDRIFQIKLWKNYYWEVFVKTKVFFSIKTFVTKPQLDAEPLLTSQSLSFRGPFKCLKQRQYGNCSNKQLSFIKRIRREIRKNIIRSNCLSRRVVLSHFNKNWQKILQKMFEKLLHFLTSHFANIFWVVLISCSD